ncbi:unnamed protein product [Chilo suppressalis]|uniref:Insulin-like domain-containing protein n=1 Tax=Chilo suppressalis TaxID=168631 RepID=A0ABN8AUV6_CHISP|nr:unnamed protein product [Chilo suppressalis]
MKGVILMLLSSVGLASLSSEDDSPQVYCGRRLALTLAYICENKPLPKRTGFLTEYEGWPWFAPRDAKAFQSPKRKRGVISECCDQPCSVNELATYC